MEQSGSTTLPDARDHGDRTTVVLPNFLGSPAAYFAVDSPGVTVRQAWHTHPDDEHVTVLDGWVEVRYRRAGRIESARAEAGQRLTVPAELEHRITGQGLFESMLAAGSEWPPVHQGEEG